MQHIDTTQAEELLRQYYQACYAKVSGSDYYRLFADEKLKHSFQVIGAGNYIMRHEKVFQTSRADFLRCAKLAYLFHDIGRFTEIERRCAEEPHPQKHKHAIYSYDILRRYPEYNRPGILLPVKYHSCMIDELYKAPEFLALSDSQLRRDVEEITFLVRDADKIANLYLMKTSAAKSDKVFSDLFLDHKGFSGVSPQILQAFMSGQVAPLGSISTADDWLVSYMSWTYDLNYKASFDFCRRTGCFANLQEVFNKHTTDTSLQEQIGATLQGYIRNRYQHFKGE